MFLFAHVTISVFLLHVHFSLACRHQAVKEIVTGFGRPALHARTLAFNHPSTGQRLYFHSDIPSDFSSVLQALRRLT